LSIRTMGFRGEALPSIASVSKVRLLTACRHESVGTQLLVTGGAITKIEEAAAAPGTQVEVRDLFFNTPARRKFLKTTTTEFSHISQVIQQASLAWPRMQFRLRHNGQDVFEYAAVSSYRDRVLQVYGTRFLDQTVEVRGERLPLEIRRNYLSIVGRSRMRQSSTRSMTATGRSLRKGVIRSSYSFLK